VDNNQIFLQFKNLCDPLFRDHHTLILSSCFSRLLFVCVSSRRSLVITPSSFLCRVWLSPFNCCISRFSFLCRFRRRRSFASYSDFIWKLGLYWQTAKLVIPLKLLVRVSMYGQMDVYMMVSGDGMRNGFGKILWPSGVLYEGEFSGGYIHGNFLYRIQLIFFVN